MNVKIGSTEFCIEDRLAKKLDLMCARVMKTHPRLDACLENAGYEGTGKTNGSIIEAGYIKNKTNRPISLFFKTSSCLKFAQSTKEQIIILDEPSFESLGQDQTSINKDFQRLVTTMREKRHFFIFNFAKFWKFPDWLVVDRALGMVYSYLKKGTIFRYVYLRQNKLPKLWDAHKKSKKNLYIKLKSFGGNFPYVAEKIWGDLDIRVEDIEHSTFKDYLKQRDLAVESIGVKISKKELAWQRKLNLLRYKITLIYKRKLIKQEQLAQIIGVSASRLREWADIDPNNMEILEKFDNTPPINEDNLEYRGYSEGVKKNPIEEEGNEAQDK